MFKRWLILLTVAGGGVAAAQPAAFTPEQRAGIVQILRQALQEDPSILRDALAAMQAGDEARARADAANAIAVRHDSLFADAADPVAGNASGPVSVVEFYDPRCPYCRQMLPVLAALLRADPSVRLVYKDIPILGPASVLVSRALLAAQRQGGYARLQAALMTGTAPPSAATIRTAAAREGLDTARLERDMDDPAIQARLDHNVDLAAALHIEGTPALIVGSRLIPGAVDLPELQSAVAAASR